MDKPRRSLCPLARVDLIGDRWTLLVVRDLACGKRQFHEFAKSPEGIATNILADRLAALIAHELAERYVTDDLPKREGYRLTAKGRSLGPVLDVVARWGLSHVEGTEAILKPTFD